MAQEQSIQVNQLAHPFKFSSDPKHNLSVKQIDTAAKAQDNTTLGEQLVMQKDPSQTRIEIVDWSDSNAESS